jgi:multiple sugar transport system substrate-binding protein
MRGLIARRRLIAIAGSSVLLAACGGAAAPTAAPAKPADTPKPADTSKPAGTSKPADTPQAAAAPATKPGATLRYHARTGSEADTLNDRLPEFKQKTGVEVKSETFPGGEYYQKMQALIAGGQLGDVFWGSLGIGWPIWGASGVMRPLDEFVQAEKFDTSQYYKAAIDQLYYQGKLYGLPFKLQAATIGIYYNADQVKEAGAKEPSLDMTYDDLIQLGKTFTKASGSRTERWGFLPYWTGASDVQGGWYVTISYVRAWGGELMNEDGTKSTILTDPKVKEAITFMHELVFKHKISPAFKDIPNSDHDAMFVGGQATMYQSGSWTKSVPTRVKDKFVVKDTLMPKGPSGKRGGMDIADLIGINGKTQLPKESWELTKFLTDKETGIRLGEGRGGASGTSGGRTDVFSDDRLMKNPLHPIWKDAVESSPGPRFAANFRTAEYNTALWQKMIGLLVGDEQLGDKFFNDLNAALQQVLDMPKP